jgi:outer membrane immunogenic protein
MRKPALYLSLFASIASMGCLSRGALAADVEMAPPEPAVFDWSGFYIGVQGGWKNHEDDVEDPIADLGDTFDFDGATFGGHAGFDHQMGPLVLGIVGDIEWDGGDGRSDEFGDDVFAKAEANWEASIRGRIGFAFDQFMIYGTAGWSFANYDFDYTCCGVGFGIGDEFDETIDGPTFGGGAAWKVSPALAIWAEYRHTEYDETSSDITNCCAPPPNSQDHDIDTDAVRVGISYYFGP